MKTDPFLVKGSREELEQFMSVLRDAEYNELPSCAEGNENREDPYASIYCVKVFSLGLSFWACNKEVICSEGVVSGKEVSIDEFYRETNFRYEE